MSSPPLTCSGLVCEIGAIVTVSNDFVGRYSYGGRFVIGREDDALVVFDSPLD